MANTDSVLHEDKKIIYVFDFDGTLFLCDLLQLYLIYHFIFFNDRIFIIKSLFSIFKRKSLCSIRKEIFIYLSKKYNLNNTFKSFACLFFLKYFLRTSLYSFLIKKYELKSNILILTANYENLVKSFLNVLKINENKNFNIIGTSIPHGNGTFHDKIVKGKIKVEKMLERLKNQNIQIDSCCIHHFYDSYEDRFVCDFAERNIFFGNSIKYKAFFKDSYDSLTFTKYLKINE